MKGAAKYLINAKDLLKKAGRENGYYKEPKYVRMACGTAYSGVLIALDDYLLKRNRPIIKKKHQRKNVQDYKSALATINKKLFHKFEGTYNVLHLDGYYEGIVERKVIDVGMTLANEIITGIEKNRF